MKQLHASRKLRVQDAIFMASYAKLNKERIMAELLADPRLQDCTKNQLEAISIIRKELSCSRRIARYLVEGKTTLEALYGARKMENE